MHRDQIQSVLRYWFGRQQEAGPESAFRFESYAGPNRVPMSAEYPNSGLTEETRTHTAKDKGKGRDTAKDKGKGRDSSQLNNLLPLPRNFTPNPIRPNPDGADDAQDEWVRIDMRQMVMLQNMGHNSRGPINGPNEGLPQYEVPRSWLQLLSSGPAPTPSQLPTGDRAYPRPRPIPPPPSELEHTPNSSVLDPALFESTNANAVAGPSALVPAPTPSQLPTGDRSYPRPRPIQSRPSERNNTVIPDPANVEPMNPNADAGQSEPVRDAEVSGSGNLGLPDPDSGPNEGPATEPMIPSPPVLPQTRSTKKRKVMSTDDLALQEAKELLKGTSRRNRTRTRRRG